MEGEGDALGVAVFEYQYRDTIGRAVFPILSSYSRGEILLKGMRGSVISRSSSRRFYKRKFKFRRETLLLDIRLSKIREEDIIGLIKEYMKNTYGAEILRCKVIWHASQNLRDFSKK